ncbi:MAG: Crp/Fnr family transcriptional regulator [Magnetococcales bacterium]|nr:Crp/Fnr family transcriptional regulator [Magnetococcales bacterium]NGZ05596.1 Crp/Fnr family transcriptional regulator [Magnetococcales bacterium]
MLVGTKDRDQDRKALLELWRQLEVTHKQTLLRFARFLVSEQQSDTPPRETEWPTTPLAIPRPAQESAVAGLKRLKKNYPMIEADEKVLAEASRILMSKVMGVPDAEVIDRLECFFADCYQKWQTGQNTQVNVLEQ